MEQMKQETTGGGQVMKRALLLFALTALLAGCGSGGGAAGLPWSDDFSSVSTWQAESDAAAQVSVEAGVLRVFVAVPNQLAWATAGRDLRDFHLTVETTQIAGPDDNEYGVLVRLQDPANFYRFSISGDGYVLVDKFVAGQMELMGATWMPAEAIRQGEASNVLEVICRGAEMTFIVNGSEVARVRDTTFTHGDIGLYAGTFYEGGVEVQFDNLRVTEP